MAAEFTLTKYLETRRRIVDDALHTYLPPGGEREAELMKAMRYSLFAGGKRLRPILCLGACEAVGGVLNSALPVACALEMIHTYSLIHDDLPAMDNDDFRRGRPTNHKVFGDAVAILAGDALLTEAFHLMALEASRRGAQDAAIWSVMGDIARAAGHGGMVGGQAMDILSEGAEADPETLYYIHTHKTAALIAASVKAGARLGGADARQEEILYKYGSDIGLAFQISDDILNVDGAKEVLGKNTGSDASRGKLTYPAVIGLAASRAKTSELIASAIQAIAGFDEKALPLRKIAEFIMERKS